MYEWRQCWRDGGVACPDDCAEPFCTSGVGAGVTAAWPVLMTALSRVCTGGVGAGVTVAWPVSELLSSNLCSLRGGETRFAFSCIWEITPKAEIVNTKFHKSIIRCANRSLADRPPVQSDTLS